MTNSTCSDCGAQLAPGAKFCRSCGRSTTGGSGPEVMCATCGHLNPPDSSFCRSCGVALPEGGVTRQSGPPTVPQPHPSAPAPHANDPASAAPAPHTFPPPAPPPNPGSGNTTLLILAIVLVLVAVGVGGVLLVRSGDSHRPTVAAVNEQTTTTITEPTTSTAQPEATEGTSTTSSPSGASASADPYSEVSTIETVLREFHEDVLSNNFHGAWELTSLRYRRQKENEPGGYPAWEKNQQTLQRYLDPSGLKVSIYSWEEKPQIATVRVTGMRWSEPGSSCSHFQGITWMHHEGDTWYYEPGYSVSPQRRAQWEGRKPALLGWGCA
jgi:ribosomal protein L40E